MDQGDRNLVECSGDEGYFRIDLDTDNYGYVVDRRDEIAWPLAN